MTYVKSVVLTAPSMMRTISHLKVQMLTSEGGQRRGTWDRVHKGHRKMARKPVSSSWLSQPGHTTEHRRVSLSWGAACQEKNRWFPLLCSKPAPDHSLLGLYRQPKPKLQVHNKAACAMATFVSDELFTVQPRPCPFQINAKINKWCALSKHSHTKLENDGQKQPKNNHT